MNLYKILCIFYTCHDADPIHFKVETGCISSIDYFWEMIDKIQIGKSEFIYSLFSYLIWECRTDVSILCNIMYPW